MDDFLVDVFLSDKHEVVSVNDTTSTSELYKMVEKKLQVEERRILLYFGDCYIERSSINTCGSLGLRLNAKITVKFEIRNMLTCYAEFQSTGLNKGSHAREGAKARRVIRHTFPGYQLEITNEPSVPLSKTIYLVSKCHNCPNAHDIRNEACESCLTDGRIVDEIVTRRSDAWLVVCEVFNNYIGDDIKKLIEENSSSSSVRLIDLMYHLYHSDPTLTWDIIRNKVERKDSDLAKAIADSLKQ